MEAALLNHLKSLIPAALYARVSSERQDVDLSITTQLRAHRPPRAQSTNQTRPFRTARDTITPHENNHLQQKEKS